MTLFWDGIPESFLKFFTSINKIVQGKDLSKVPQKFRMTRNIVVGESLQLFEQKTWDRVNENKLIYKLVMIYLFNCFFPPEALQRQKRYLLRGLYKPRNTKIWDFVCRVD